MEPRAQSGRYARLCILAALLAWPTAAWGADGPVSVRGASAGCPTPAAVAKELRTMMPGVPVNIGGAGRPVRLEDLGPRYRVRAAAVVRDLEDPARRCAERARSAAVIATLALAPPAFGTDPNNKPPPGPSRWRASLEVGPVTDLAPGAEASVEPTIGLSVRASVGKGSLRLVGGVAAHSPTTTNYGPVTARLFRVPMDLGIRALWRRGAFELGGELAVVATLLRAEGQDIERPSTGIRLDVGLRASVVVRHWVGTRIGWYFSPLFHLSPRPFELAIEPQGVVATTPRVRAGVVAGVLFRLK